MVHDEGRALESENLITQATIIPHFLPRCLLAWSPPPPQGANLKSAENILPCACLGLLHTLAFAVLLLTLPIPCLSGRRRPKEKSFLRKHLWEGGGLEAKGKQSDFDVGLDFGKIHNIARSS